MKEESKISEIEMGMDFLKKNVEINQQEIDEIRKENEEEVTEEMKFLKEKQRKEYELKQKRNKRLEKISMRVKQRK